MSSRNNSFSKRPDTLVKRKEIKKFHHVILFAILIIESKRVGRTTREII